MAMSALGKKLVRDMRRSGMQFFAIVMLCSLGTFMFAGLDGTARLAQGTIDTYFAQNNPGGFLGQRAQRGPRYPGANPFHQRSERRMRPRHGGIGKHLAWRAHAERDGL